MPESELHLTGKVSKLVEAFNEQLEAQCSTIERRLRRVSFSGNVSSVTAKRFCPCRPRFPMTPSTKRTTLLDVAVIGALSRSTTSVPTRYGRRRGVVKGYVDEIGDLLWQRTRSRRHRRSYEREEMIFDPLALARTSGTQDQGVSDQRSAAFAWESPEQFMLETFCGGAVGKPGKREYVPGIAPPLLRESSGHEARCRGRCAKPASWDELRCSQALSGAALATAESLDLRCIRILAGPSGGADLQAADFWLLLNCTRRGRHGEVETSAQAHWKALRLPTFRVRQTGAAMRTPELAFERSLPANSASWNLDREQSWFRAPHQG